MSRRQIDPLRPLTAEERGWLARISLSHSEPAAHVARATMLLAVAAGHTSAQKVRLTPGILSDGRFMLPS